MPDGCAVRAGCMPGRCGDRPLPAARMGVMSDSLSVAAPAGAFSRRALLAAAVVGTAAVAAGCTGSEEDRSDAVTPAQVDQLAEQVAVQAALVTAHDRTIAASPGLAADV